MVSSSRSLLLLAFSVSVNGNSMWLRPNPWESFLSAHIRLSPTPAAANSVFPGFEMIPESAPFPHSAPPLLPSLVCLPTSPIASCHSSASNPMGPHVPRWALSWPMGVHMPASLLQLCHQTMHTCAHTHTASLPLFPSLTLANKPCISHPGASALSLPTICYVLPTDLHGYIPPFLLSPTQASPCQRGNTAYPICTGVFPNPSPS